ncbi:MAG: hypothetical protein ACK4SB_16860, partial [Belliella pelovolcani]
MHLIKSLFRFFYLIIEYGNSIIFHSRYTSLAKRFDIFRFLLLLTIKSKFKPDLEVNQQVLGLKISANKPYLLLALFREIFIDEVYTFEAFDHKPKIIDCGANIGVSVLYFKFRHPN